MGMEIVPVRTRIFKEHEDVIAFITQCIPSLAEGSIVAIASKVVALAEGRTASLTEKERLITEGSAWRRAVGPRSITITQGLFMTDAGIDESNMDGRIAALPEDCMASAARIRQGLQKAYGCERLGVIITDSRLYPLRAGVTGIALGYAGFAGLRSYVGKKDIFGKVLEVSRTNVPDCLASAAVLMMGEGDECQPLAIIANAPVMFQDAVAKDELLIDPKEDMYFPLLTQDVAVAQGSEKFRPYLAVYLILRHGNDALFMRRQNTGFQDGKFSFPAGHVEEGETTFQALVRESEEEAGIVPKDPQVVHVMYRRSPDRVYVDIYYLTDSYEGEPVNAEPHKCSEIVWHPLDSPPDGMIDYVASALKNILDNVPYSEYGW